MENVHNADAELRHPVHFLSEAIADLRHAPRVAWRLFVRNMQSRYRRTWLSYVWLLLPSAGTTLVWTFVQSRRIVGIESTGMPYPVFVFSGMVLWQTFVDALNAPLQQLSAGRQMITRSRVPHEALILAGLYEVGANTLARLVVLAALMVAYGVTAGTWSLLGVLGIASLALAGLTLGIIAAPLGLLYDDVQRAILMITGFWFFLTPVVYPLPAGSIMWLNPLSPLIETTRLWLTGHAADGGTLLAMSILTLAVLVPAWLFQRLARPHVVARLG